MTGERESKLLLIAILAASFLLHAAIFFSMEPSGYHLYDTDTWYSIRQAERISHGEDPRFDEMLNPPGGDIIEWGVMVPFLYSFFISPSDSPLDIFNKLAWLPPITVVIFSVAIYFLVGRLFSSETGSFASILVALSPGIFFQNGMYGILDHHLAESILLTIAILCILIFAKESRPRFLLVATVCAAMMPFNSNTWGIYVAMILFCILMCLIIRYHRSWLHITAIVLTGISFGALSLLSGTKWISLWTGWHDPISEISCSDPLLLMARINVLVLPIAIVMAYLCYNRDARVIPLVILLIIMGIVTLRFSRFEYILMPFVCIVAAIGIGEIIPRKQGNIIAAAFMAISIILCASTIVSLSNFERTNSDWPDALEEIRAQDAGVVLAWWDYGHWISSIANQSPYADPFQNHVVETAVIFTSDPVIGEKLVASRNVSHIMISDTDRNFYNAMVSYSKSTVGYNESYLKYLIDSPPDNRKIYRKGIITVYDITQ
jgi:asparagine N-glycosylation enzyme membrane subunit Stt3